MTQVNTMKSEIPVFMAMVQGFFNTFYGIFMKKRCILKAFQEMEKNCKKQFFHQTHLYLPPLEHRNGGHNGLLLKPEEAPWFERQPEATRWLKEQEENQLQGENIDRPDTKWRLE